MKNSCSSVEVDPQSNEWDELTRDAPWLQSKIVLNADAKNHRVKTIISKDYCCCEYKMKLNIFTFGRLKIELPFRVIAPPVSVDAKGYIGNLESLIDDYKRKKGLFLILNLQDTDLPSKGNKIAIGKTLPSCIFKNDFHSFDDYMLALRSTYRRRINIALEKGKSIIVRKIDNKIFDDDMYNLYLQVLQKSDFPLETLTKDFFVNSPCHIYGFYKNNTAIAFIMVSNNGNFTNFIFGGMDYKYRDEYDIYYNMLLSVIKIGICEKSQYINFGQTAEDTKCRLGCVVDSRYMVGFSNSKILTSILRLGASCLENNKKIVSYNVFKT